VDTKTCRLDSVHIFSNMRHLGRIGIFVKAITKFLVNLKRHHRDLFESLSGSFSERYLTRKGQGVFSMVSLPRRTGLFCGLQPICLTLSAVSPTTRTFPG
jgi:hypothetical protein